VTARWESTPAERAVLERSDWRTTLLLVILLLILAAGLGAGVAG
jgi:hypothetical protein